MTEPGAQPDRIASCAQRIADGTQCSDPIALKTHVEIALRAEQRHAAAIAKARAREHREPAATARQHGNEKRERMEYALEEEGETIAALILADRESSHMPDILTKADQKHVLITPATCRCKRYADYPCSICDGGLAVCSLCGAAEIELDGPCLPQKASEAVSDSENQSSAKSEPVVATPESIHISLPALRAVVLAAIDAGYYLIYHADETLANNQRLCLADEIERRLRQLPTWG